MMMIAVVVPFAQWALRGSHSHSLEPESRRMCIRRRNEWDGLLLGSGYEELLAMTMADLQAVSLHHLPTSVPGQLKLCALERC
jgi:hypothetical protein